MTDYTNLLERLAVSAGDQECLYADAKAAIEALQTRLAEAEDTNKALRVRLGSELHEPVTTVEDRYNADGKSCHITDDLPAGMKLYARPVHAEPVNSACFERFAAIIEAAATEKANELADQRVVAEREACAKACEEQERGAGDAMTFYTATGQCAAAIRNRKDTTE